MMNLPDPHAPDLTPQQEDWFCEQHRVDASYVRLIASLAMGYHGADPGELARLCPANWATPEAAAADIELAGWSFRLARPSGMACGEPPVHLTWIDRGARRHVWYFDGIDTFTDGTIARSRVRGPARLCGSSEWPARSR